MLKLIPWHVFDSFLVRIIHTKTLFPGKLHRIGSSSSSSRNISSSSSSLAKEQDKIQKYQSLAHDYHVMYRMPVLIVPVVVGCTDVVSSNCISHLRCIPKYPTTYFLQFIRQPSSELFMSHDLLM